MLSVPECQWYASRELISTQPQIPLGVFKTRTGALRSDSCWGINTLGPAVENVAKPPI